MAGTRIAGTRLQDRATASIAARLENVTSEQALDTLRTVADKLGQHGKTLVLTGISDSRKTLVFKRWTDASAGRRRDTAKAIEILLDAQAQQWGPIRHRHNGKDQLHDRASYRYYWTVLQRARQTGQTLPKEADGLL